jgi:hypothetical protein
MAFLDVTFVIHEIQRCLHGVIARRWSRIERDGDAKSALRKNNERAADLQRSLDLVACANR